MSYKEWREQFLEENRLQAQKRKDELMADWWVECMEQARAEVQLQQPPATPSDAEDADESGGVWAHVKREQVKEEVVDDEDDVPGIEGSCHGGPGQEANSEEQQGRIAEAAWGIDQPAAWQIFLIRLVGLSVLLTEWLSLDEAAQSECAAYRLF